MELFTLARLMHICERRDRSSHQEDVNSSPHTSSDSFQKHKAPQKSPRAPDQRKETASGKAAGRISRAPRARSRRLAPCRGSRATCGVKESLERFLQRKKEKLGRNDRNMTHPFIRRKNAMLQSRISNRSQSEYRSLLDTGKLSRPRTRLSPSPERPDIYIYIYMCVKVRSKKSVRKLVENFERKKHAENSAKTRAPKQVPVLSLSQEAHFFLV